MSTAGHKGRPIGVLVVDDSPFARKAIARMLAGDPDIRVVAQAGDGEAALRALEGEGVDAVTLDLEMPGMGGLATLAAIRASRPVPVIVLSGAAEQGAAVTLQALDLGAFDVVAKPSGGPLALHSAGAELVAKIRAAVGAPPAATRPPSPSSARGPARAAGPTGAALAPWRREAAAPVEVTTARPGAVGGRPTLIVLGTSTGGPPALQALIPALPADFPVPILVCQHMPPGYTRALAERLDRLAAMSVAEAADGDELVAGRVLVAPAGRQLGLRPGPRGPRVVLTDDCPIASFYSPCIDYTFQQAAAVAEAGLLAVVMTGMGADGALGLRAVKAAGGTCWAQDEASSTIFGMPRSAIETGLVDAVVALDALAGALVAQAAKAPASA